MKPITLWQMRETSADLEFRGELLQKMKEKELTAYERELHSFLDKLSIISGEANPDQTIAIKKMQASSNLLNELLENEKLRRSTLHRPLARRTEDENPVPEEGNNGKKRLRGQQEQKIENEEPASPRDPSKMLTDVIDVLPKKRGALSNIGAGIANISSKKSPLIKALLSAVMVISLALAGISGLGIPVIIPVVIFIAAAAATLAYNYFNDRAQAKKLSSPEPCSHDTKKPEEHEDRPGSDLAGPTVTDRLRSTLKQPDALESKTGRYQELLERHRHRHGEYLDGPHNRHHPSHTSHKEF